jgi:hypothetical protein
LIECQQYHELAAHPWVWVHDLFEFLWVGEDHGGVFVEIVFKTGPSVVRNKPFFIIGFCTFQLKLYLCIPSGIVGDDGAHLRQRQQGWTMPTGRIDDHTSISVFTARFLASFFGIYDFKNWFLLF